MNDKRIFTLKEAQALQQAWNGWAINQAVPQSLLGIIPALGIDVTWPYKQTPNKQIRTIFEGQAFTLDLFTYWDGSHMTSKGFEPNTANVILVRVFEEAKPTDTFRDKCATLLNWTIRPPGMPDINGREKASYIVMGEWINMIPPMLKEVAGMAASIQANQDALELQALALKLMLDEVDEKYLDIDSDYFKDGAK